MSIRSTLESIRGLGCTARYLSALREFRVNIPSGSELTAYYTDDPQDAIGTARQMVARSRVHITGSPV
jgi:hypothetical protein